jgi:D-alanyl-D-alanine carboxypeptidase
LGRGWEGIKTGHTAPAGGCLASIRNGVFTIVLNCANKDARFEDTIMLYEWYQKKMGN